MDEYVYVEGWYLSFSDTSVIGKIEDLIDEMIEDTESFRYIEQTDACKTCGENDWRLNKKEIDKEGLLKMFGPYHPGIWDVTESEEDFTLRIEIYDCCRCGDKVLWAGDWQSPKEQEPNDKTS